MGGLCTPIGAPRNTCQRTTNGRGPGMVEESATVRI